MSPSTSSSLNSEPDYIARRIKLSPCYFYFYLVQIGMAIAVCSFLYFERTDLIPFVEIPIAFSIALDLYDLSYFRILSHYGSSSHSCLSNVEIINMLVLVGCVATIVLDLTIPEETHDKANMISGIMLISRYAVQSIWVLKLISESKKIIETSKMEYISFDSHF